MLNPGVIRLMKTCSHQVLPIEKKHLAELVLLEGHCFSDPWTIDQYLESLEQNNFKALGIFQDKELIAYISFNLMYDEAEIINLAVHPRYRRTGLARSLVSKALEICSLAMVKKVFLEVRPSNYPALGIYRGFGFRKISRRKKYYSDNLEDALVLRLDLSPFKT